MATFMSTDQATQSGLSPTKTYITKTDLRTVKNVNKPNTYF